nr:ribonuclease H-like domain-containing protein [Tanacetum cinerariifolium]
MNQFCQMKGIKREFSVARTPQQNGVAKRKNRTLIEAARTMLADSLFPTTFWAEAVNTACYVQNRVLVTKPHNKTPYELLIGRSTNLEFMRPFGCPVTILNTLDNLGKIDGKADEGFLVGYSINSKAFRVFNSRTRKVEKNLHVNFLENKPNVAGRSGPKWLFDIDLLTQSINYELVYAGNQSNDDTGMQTDIHAGQASQEKAVVHEYILLPFIPLNPPLFSTIQSSDVNAGHELGDLNAGDIHGNEIRIDRSTHAVNAASPSINTASNIIDAGSLNINTDDSNHTNMPTLEATGIFDGEFDDRDMGAEVDTNNLESSTVVSPIPTTRVHKDHPKEQIIRDPNLNTQTRRMINFSKETSMLDISHARRASSIQTSGCMDFGRFTLWKRAIGSKWVFRNKLDKRGIVIRNKARLVAQRHTQEEGIDYDEVFALVSRIEAIRLFQAYASFKDFIVYQMDVKSAFLYGKIEEEVYVCQPPGFEDIDFPDKVFSEVKTASTPMETLNPLLKDEDGEEVDVHMYRSMIGSLMYLTFSRPDIMFALCACARHQVSPKASHLHIVKRIFRYLKGQPKLGLWYPKDSPFELEAYTDSDYARSSLDRKSITGGCQFLCCRLISWQCKKQTMIAKFTTEAEYVAASSCYRQSRSRGLRRLKKFGSSRRVKPPMENDSLGAKEDASKQGRIIDQNVEIALDDETHGRTNEDEMFGVDDLAREDVVMDTTTGEHEERIIKDVSTAEPVTTAGEVVTTTTVKESADLTKDVTEDEITMAQALAALKSIKPKVVVQEQEMSTTILAVTTTVTTAVPTPRAKDYWLNGFKQEKGKNSLRDMRKVNDFIAMDSEAEKSSAKEAQESSTKRTAEHLESDISKKQKVDENVEPVIDDSVKLKKCMEIVPDDGDEVLIEATSLSSKSPTIIDYKIHKEGKKTYFKIIRADEKVYPLTRNILHQLWSDVRLQVDYDAEMAYDLLRFIRKQLMQEHQSDTFSIHSDDGNPSRANIKQALRSVLTEPEVIATTFRRMTKPYSSISAVYH